MKVSCRKLFPVFFISCFILTAFLCTGMAAENEMDAAAAKYLKENNFQIITENTLMTLYADETSGEFAVEDNRDHFVWFSNPIDRDGDKIAQGIVKMDLSSQLNIMYSDLEGGQLKVKNNFTGSIKKNSVKFEKIADGFKVTYSFPGEDGFSIPLNITLGETFLSAEVDIANIKETQNKIYTVDLLPYFGAGNSTDNGYIFIPDGSGALIYFNNGKKSAETYKETIYGRDMTFESNQNPIKREEIKLPVFGIKNGDNAFIAVVDKGESQGSITANVSGIKTTYNNVFTSFDIRRYDSFVVGEGGMNVTTTRLYEKGKTRIGGCKINYYLLQGEEADYSGMANVYRDYLTNEKGLKANTDIKPQMYLDLYGAVRKQKSILGIPFNIVQPLTTYKDTMNILDDLKKSDVRDIVVNYHDWYSEAIDGKIPISASTIRKLGGSKGFNELIAYSKDNEVKLCPQVDFLKILKGNLNFLKISNEARTLGTTPAKVFGYKLSTYFRDIGRPVYNLMMPNKLGKVLTRFTNSYRNYNINGIGLDTISSMVYSDFSNGNLSTRQETETRWIDTLKLMKKEYGTVVASAPNAYALPYVDYIFDVPADSSHYYIEDDTIPFYQMVIRGVKPYTIESFNFSADKNTKMLRAIETGANPHYEWVGQDTSLLRETKYEGLYSAGYESWMSTAKEDFAVFKKLYDKIQSSTITDHNKLAEGVFKSVYDNGVSVIVNYSTVEYRIGNRMIAPKNYVIMEEGNQE